MKQMKWEFNQKLLPQVKWTITLSPTEDFQHFLLLQGAGKSEIVTSLTQNRSVAWLKQFPYIVITSVGGRPVESEKF